jgi:hypothetical protein
MIQETQVTLRKQTPTAPNEWLYKATFEQKEKEVVNENGETEIVTEEVEVRSFHPSVYLGKDDAPYSECSNEEKLAWEEANKEAEPTEEVIN